MNKDVRIPTGGDLPAVIYNSPNPVVPDGALPWQWVSLTDNNNSPITTYYFRKQFSVGSTNGLKLNVRQLIDDGRDGVAREAKLQRAVAARRQAMAWRQRAAQDRRAELIVELPCQGGAARGSALDIDQPRENVAHQTGSVIFTEMDL